MILPEWARLEQNLGGRVFSRENRLVPPAQWSWSALWDDCLLAKYEIGENPYGEAVVFNKAGTPIGVSLVKEGQLVRLWPTRIARGNNPGNIVISIKMKHAYRRNFRYDDVPELCATYLNDVLLHYDGKDGCYKLVRVGINGEIFDREVLEESNSGYYYMSLMETVANELLYLDTQVPPNMKGREKFQINPKGFYESKYRYRNFQFFLSHMKWILIYEQEEKELEEKKRKTPITSIKTTTYDMTGEHVGTVNRYTFSNPSETYVKLFGKMEVSGKVINENITSSTANPHNPPIATALDSETGWIIVFWPQQYYHAFWVFKSTDYSWFVDSEGVLDRSKADESHPFYRFKHTEPSFKKLMKMVYDKEVVFDND